MPYAERPNVVAYVGALNSYRNVQGMVEAVGMLPPELNARLLLMGHFLRARNGFRQMLEGLYGWERVDYAGELPRDEMAARLMRSRVGITVLSPTPEHSVALGNKMFEYMAAGIPQVCSDFPLWREIVEDAGLGLTVDPTDPAAIAAALQHLFEHPDDAEAMGLRARAAAAECYSWECQERDLLELYEGLTEQESAPPLPLPLSGLRP